MMSPTPTTSSNGRLYHPPEPQHHQHHAHQQEQHAGPTATAMLNRSISTVQPQQPGQPTQSRSFRILQMITDTAHDPSSPEAAAEAETENNGRLSRSSVGSNNSGGSGRISQHQPPAERRLLLTQEDRELMDMFRSQVNEEQSLHQEADPRYRGSHIPSRAFRILQNFTAETDDAGHHQQPVVRQQIAQQAQAQQQQQQQRVRAPPSEQSVPEPAKYMGGNIPSRSFRMLQAMTSTDPNDGKSDL